VGYLNLLCGFIFSFSFRPTTGSHRHTSLNHRQCRLSQTNDTDIYHYTNVTDKKEFFQYPFLGIFYILYSISSE